MDHHFILLRLNLSALWRLGVIVVSALLVTVAGLLVSRGCQNISYSRDGAILGKFDHIYIYIHIYDIYICIYIYIYTYIYKEREREKAT